MPHAPQPCHRSFLLPYRLLLSPTSAFPPTSLHQIHRHHKRTPYATNAFPRETHPWWCDDERLFHYAISPPQDSSVHVTWQVDTSDANPFAPIGFHGSCRFPQITSQGLRDSRQHGQDLFEVYHRLLGFLPSTYDPMKLQYRATNNLITSQVIGHIIQGQFPDMANMPVAVRVQPPSIDSLEPSYACPSASSLHRAYAVGSSAENWTLHLDQSAALFTKLDSVSGVDPTAPDWHSWFDHYYDNLSARLCHQKSLPCQSTNASNCITQADADSVFRRGQYEYSFVYRDAPQSLTASIASFGIWVAELASNLRVVVDSGRQLIRGPAPKVLYRHNVAHDGSISHLLSILQVDIMVWPGMGAELVFELYRRDVEYHLRVLWGGNILTSSNPHLGTMDLIPVQVFLAYIDGLVGPKGVNVPHLCHEAKDRVA